MRIILRIFACGLIILLFTKIRTRRQAKEKVCSKLVLSVESNGSSKSNNRSRGVGGGAEMRKTVTNVRKKK